MERTLSKNESRLVLDVEWRGQKNLTLAELRTLLGCSEMISEKVRAAFQRAKVRDLYDLHRFATTPFDGGLLRRLAVLKLWQVKDPFDPDAFFEQTRSAEYDWDDLHRLVWATERFQAKDILRAVETRFAPLRNLSELERALIADARSGRNERLAEQLRKEIRGCSK